MVTIWSPQPINRYQQLPSRPGNTIGPPGEITMASRLLWRLSRREENHNGSRGKQRLSSTYLTYLYTVKKKRKNGNGWKRMGVFQSSDSDVSVPVFRAIDSSCRGEKHNQPRWKGPVQTIRPAGTLLRQMENSSTWRVAWFMGYRPWKGPLGVESRLLMSHERSWWIRMNLVILSLTRPPDPLKNAIGCSMMQKPTLQPPHGIKVPSDGGIPQKIAQEIMFTGKMMRNHKFWGVPSGYD